MLLLDWRASPLLSVLRTRLTLELVVVNTPNDLLTQRPEMHHITFPTTFVFYRGDQSKSTNKEELPTNIFYSVRLLTV